MRLVRVALAISVLGASVLAKDLKRPAITGIAFVRVYTNDIAASRKFYVERLQLPESACGNGCANYEVGKGQFVQVLEAKGRNNGMEVVAFRTSDAEALRKYLASRGIKVPNSLTRNSDGSAEFEITDSERHRVAFYQAGKEAAKRGGISHRMIHVGFVVKDRAAMDKLYKDVLGFRPYWFGGWKEDHPVWVSQQVPDGSDWLEYMLDIPSTANHHDLGVQNHFSLGVNDINDAAKGLEKSGWKASEHERAQMGRDGKRQLNVYDPDEVRVEFMEFKPAEKPCCSDFTGKHPSESD